MRNKHSSYKINGETINDWMVTIMVLIKDIQIINYFAILKTSFEYLYKFIKYIYVNFRKCLITVYISLI